MKNLINPWHVSRRKLIKAGAISTLLLIIKKMTGGNTEENNISGYGVRSCEEMRPNEILKAIEKKPYAFVPVSPMIEWHSFHLPVGTDALISEAMCRIMSETIGGIWFRPLSLGLDSWRDESQKKMWGLKPEESVFGMNFPDVPLKSEYCGIDEMKKLIINRVNTLRGIGLKHVFLLNHHGGKGQFAIIDDLADELTDDTIRIHCLRTYQFNDLTEEDGFYGVGGHAGYSETTWLMAFRPELTDLTQQKAGELSVRKTGILHDKPMIEEKWNPGNVSFSVANKLRNSVTKNFAAYLEELG